MHIRSAGIRKRPVTACTECRRRKQKCDRAQPCNMCVGRNVQGRCRYNSSGSFNEASAGIEEPPLLENTPLTTDDSYSSGSPLNQSFQDQIGYARIDEANTFSRLYELLGDNREIQAPKSTWTPRLPASTIHRLSDLWAYLPPRSVMRDLIEVYFSQANWYFAVLEEYYFEKLYSSWCALNDDLTANGQDTEMTRDLLHFPGLLFQVLAVSLQFTSLDMPCVELLGVNDMAERDRLSSDFSERGMEIVRIVGTNDLTITSTQNDLMRALWLKNSSRGKEAWQILGRAIRMAQGLGLHLQSKASQKAHAPVEETLSQLWYDEYKRKLWIKLFSWDSHMAFSLGQPRAINSSDCTIVTPLDRDIPADPATTVPVALFPHEPPSSFTPHLFQYAVCQQIHEAMSLKAHKCHLEDYDLVEVLHSRIRTLLSNLPPVHRPVNPDRSWDVSHPHIPKQREQISTAANSFLMALHRPHAKVHAASRNAAISAALGTLDAQERLFSLMAKRYYNIYALSSYTIDAGILLAVSTLEHPPSNLDMLHRIRYAIEKAIYRLELAKERAPLAHRGSQILRLCYQKMQTAPQLQLPRSNTIVHQPIQIMDSASSRKIQIDDPSSQFSRDVANLPKSTTASMFDPSQLDSTVIFEDITVPNFDIESWVQQMSDFDWALQP